MTLVSLNYHCLELLIFVSVKLSYFQLHFSCYTPGEFANLNFNGATSVVAQVDFLFHMFLTPLSDCWYCSNKKMLLIDELNLGCRR